MSMKRMPDLSPIEKKQTYYMICGEIVFRTTDNEAPNMMRLNAVVISPDGRFAVRQIASAQQALQFQFFKRMNDATLQILDVITLSLMNLGVFTDKEFNAAPAGMKMQELNKELN